MSRGLRSILTILFRHRGRVSLGVICLLAVDALQLVIPLIVRSVTDGVTGGEVTPNWVALRAAMLLAIAFCMIGFRFLWRHFFFSASRLAEMEMRQAILDHALSMSMGDLASTRTGEVMALSSNDVEAVRQLLAMGFVSGIDASIYALFALGAVFWLDPQLASRVILPLPVLAVVIGISLKAVYRRWDAVQASFEKMTEKVRESIAGIRVLKAYVQARGDSSDFARYNQDYFRKFNHYVRIDALYHPMILLMAGGCSAILLAVGGTRVIAGQTSLGTFVAMTSYLGMLVWPMIAAGWMFTLGQRAIASMDRINDFLARPVHPDAAAPNGNGTLFGHIEVCNLTFAFGPERRPALKDIRFSVAAGRSLGIVGETGAGKSTIGQLLCRLYDPPPETISIDRTDVLELPLHRLRHAIAYVAQEPFLFSDTIADNLRVGRQDATVPEMQKACHLAAVHDEIARFPDGYDTLLGERGITLSGGQKQRLALARALLKRAPILFLDDTLSAVDAEAERRILNNLRTMAGSRTTLVVSHRISAVRDLDHILVLKAGAIDQSGDHATLSAQPGFYRTLMELQEMEQ